MRMVPYSPFNKTYKYICLQNQLAHNKNKKEQKGLVDSNINVEKNLSHSRMHKSLGSSFATQNSCGGSLKKEPLVIHRD